MNRKGIIHHIQEAVQKTEPESWHNKEQNGKEAINATYNAVRPNSSRTTRSAMRIKVLSGDYFSEQISFFMELLDQCDLEIVERKS